MLKKNLCDWLKWIQSAHGQDMDLSLERVSLVAERLGLLTGLEFIITVGGTNGKGSCVRALESIYKASGYQVGTFTSPILFRHNEYVRIRGKDVSDELFCNAYEKVEQARENIQLTAFEFTALAALILLKEANLDLWILEVGLGGRFDAVNVLNADLAIVASISIDHVEWLGDTREKIGYEKAGIFRSNKPVVCGDFNPPQSLVNYANELGAVLYCQNKEFGYSKNNKGWTWWSHKNKYCLPLTQLALQNMSTVLMAIELLQAKWPVSHDVIEKTLPHIQLSGRIQVVPGEIVHIYDVAHNPGSTEYLAQWLNQNNIPNKTYAVFSMLGDKDILTCLNIMRDYIDAWFIGELKVKRAASQEILLSMFRQANISKVKAYNGMKDAYQAAFMQAKAGDRILIFGSFHTVAELWTLNARECISTL